MRDHFRRLKRRIRKLPHPDLWPHASRSSFVTLLTEKAVPTHGVGLEKAVGLRLTFRQPPPIDCFSNQFLIYLDSTVAGSAYSTWSHLASTPTALLPPERFHFQVHELEAVPAVVSPTRRPRDFRCAVSILLIR